ncbi:MAG TPA: twin-arginine translocation signal domain-containing protein, partial [Terriglobales bacterium]|nr:twin-arginine translocation signal domain-containing protein [Terriglobales bacterium]
MPRKDFSGDQDHLPTGLQSDDLTDESNYTYEELDSRPLFSRRSFLAGLGGAAVVAAAAPIASPLWAENAPVNLAVV